jgi:D-3-phosphoglycerate dehydrogenase
VSLVKLKFISVAFAGVDHVDSNSCQNKHIPIKNAAGYANTAVAELVIGLMLSLARKIPHNNQQIRCNGATNTGIELKNRTLGIVGYGAIGKEVHRLANAFKMDVIILDKNAEIGSKGSLVDVFAHADFISLHVPLTNLTKNMINMSLLKLMKKSAFLINCARGPVVNSEDLIMALNHGMLAGAALDCFESEPPLNPNLQLLNNDKIIATPHIGFNTQEALLSKGMMVIENIKEFLKNNK